jgi:uncharacterized protein YkwD
MQNRPHRYAARLRPVLLVLALVAPLLSVNAGPAGATVTFESRALELINQSRAAAGVAPMRVASTLTAIAGNAPYDGCGYRVTGRAADMGVRNYLSHTILNCGSRGVADMVKAAGVVHSALGENIAFANPITDPLVAAKHLHDNFMASPGHRANILDPRFTHVGVGFWQSAAGVNWTGAGSALRDVFVTSQIFIRAAGARYHPLTPSRILDTRTSGVALGPGATMDLQVTGAGGVPSAGVSAVILNVAVTGPTAMSHLTVFPAGVPRPWTANLNFDAGQTVPNLVTAKLGAGGRLSIFNAMGSTHVVADVAGWYDEGIKASGARFHTLTPSRILDTRNTTILGPAGTMGLQVTGRGGVPATGVSAVVMNVAVTGGTDMSHLTVFPAGQARPLASNLNWVPGDTVPNLVTAKLGAGGAVSIFNAVGSVHVIADVAGWYDDGTSATGAGYHPLTPSRILDTRDGSGAIAPAAVRELQVSGQGGVPAAGVSAVVTNVALTGPTAHGHLTIYPAGESVPGASNLNFRPAQTVANLVSAKLGAGGRVGIFNASAGSTHVIADVAGWFDAG